MVTLTFFMPHEVESDKFGCLDRGTHVVPWTDNSTVDLVVMELYSYGATWVRVNVCGMVLDEDPNIPPLFLLESENTTDDQQ